MPTSRSFKKRFANSSRALLRAPSRPRPWRERKDERSDKRCVRKQIKNDGTCSLADLFLGIEIGLAGKGTVMHAGSVGRKARGREKRVRKVLPTGKLLRPSYLRLHKQLLPPTLSGKLTKGFSKISDEGQCLTWVGLVSLGREAPSTMGLNAILLLPPPAGVERPPDGQAKRFPRLQ
jgi:hypothetical protein